jgi:hypothetical protein
MSNEIYMCYIKPFVFEVNENDILDLDEAKNFTRNVVLNSKKRVKIIFDENDVQDVRCVSIYKERGNVFSSSFFKTSFIELLWA